MRDRDAVPFFLDRCAANKPRLTPENGANLGHPVGPSQVESIGLRYSIPSCLRASGLRRSGVHCGYHTISTLALVTPGTLSRRRLTSSVIWPDEGHPCAVGVISTSTSSPVALATAVGITRTS